MSAYTILQDTSFELRRRIHAALVSAPDADLGLTSPMEDITFSPPSDEMEGTPRLSLFLYHIEPDGHLRNQPPLPNGQSGLRFPPMSLTLRYLVTPLDEDEDQNHLMLGRVLQLFHDQPFLERIADAPLGNSFGGGSPQLRIHFEPLSLEQVSQVWGALNTAYRLSVTYQVRVVAIDSDQGVVPAHRITEAHTVVGTMERQP